jgi:hypothetical protein
LPARVCVHAGECSDHSLLGELDLHKLLARSHHVLVLDAHDTTAPLSGQVVVVVVLRLEKGAELLEVDEVLAADFGKSDASGCLKVDKLAKVGLATDEAEGDTLLTAESGQVNDELNGVDVKSDHNHLGLVLLNQRGDVVETELKMHGLLGLLGGALVGSATLSLLLESVGLLLMGLRGVLSEQFKELGSLVLLEGLTELVDAGRHLQSLHENSLLSLDSDVTRPFNKASEVARRLDVSSKSEIFSVLLEERTRSSASATSTSLGLNDLLSLSFLHHND